MTSSQRAKKSRAARGLKPIQIWVTEREYNELQTLRLNCPNPFETLTEWIISCVFQAGRFRFNTGKGITNRTKNDSWVIDRADFWESHEGEILKAELTRQQERIQARKKKKRGPGRPPGSRNKKKRTSAQIVHSAD